jgi:hypothetical protein
MVETIEKIGDLGFRVTTDAGEVFACNVVVRLTASPRYSILTNARFGDTRAVTFLFIVVPRGHFDGRGDPF